MISQCAEENNRISAYIIYGFMPFVKFSVKIVSA